MINKNSNHGLINYQASYSKDYQQIKVWLTMLMETYHANPSKGLAKTILYYLHRLIAHEDIELEKCQPCDYRSLMRYWQWLAS